MVKIISASGEKRKFDSKDVKSDLQAAGLPERVAEEVAERVENKVQDQWTAAQVNEQVDLELKRLDEDIHRAEGHLRGETTRPTTGNIETMSNNRVQTFIPETERERHVNQY